MEGEGEGEGKGVGEGEGKERKRRRKAVTADREADEGKWGVYGGGGGRILYLPSPFSHHFVGGHWTRWIT